MKKQQSLNLYFDYKLAQFLSYDPDCYQNFDDESIADKISSKSFWEFFRDYLMECRKNQIVDAVMKRKILDLFCYFRYSFPSDSFILDFINQALIILNTSSGDRAFNFYRQDFILRQNMPFLKKHLLQFSKPYLILEDDIDSCQRNISSDYLVMIAHSSSFSWNEFEGFIEDYMFYGDYFGNVYSILKECPSFFQNAVFYDRVHYFLSSMYGLMIGEPIDDCIELDSDDPFDDKTILQAKKLLKVIENIKR